MYRVEVANFLESFACLFPNLCASKETVKEFISIVPKYGHFYQQTRILSANVAKHVERDNNKPLWSFFKQEFVRRRFSKTPQTLIQWQNSTTLQLGVTGSYAKESFTVKIQK